MSENPNYPTPTLSPEQMGAHKFVAAVMYANAAAMQCPKLWNTWFIQSVYAYALDCSKFAHGDKWLDNVNALQAHAAVTLAREGQRAVMDCIEEFLSSDYPMPPAVKGIRARLFWPIA
jgi:hypothetical protein